MALYKIKRYYTPDNPNVQYFGYQCTKHGEFYYAEIPDELIEGEINAGRVYREGPVIEEPTAEVIEEPIAEVVEITEEPIAEVVEITEEPTTEVIEVVEVIEETPETAKEVVEGTTEKAVEKKRKRRTKAEIAAAEENK